VHAPLAETQPEIERTYKGRDVEGIVDLVFYRRIGFQLAQFFARLNWTPVAVTLLGGVIGLIGGHLYFYRSIAINIIGFLLHVLANALDNADGQLARLTNGQSRRGRIIDSVVDHIIFANIYLHLALRAWTETGSPLVWLVAGAAAFSHALQGGAADYFRNAYLYFAKDAEWDTMSILREERKRSSALSKLLLFFYLTFTRQQEMFAPNLRRLRDLPPAIFAQSFCESARSMLRGWGLLMTNTRMLFLCAFLLLDRPMWFFWLEIIAMNLLLLFLIARQESLARRILQSV
jgi:phosphatidylglycerophosphate synthase